MKTIRHSLLSISAILALSSCSLKKAYPLLRIQIEEKTWTGRVTSGPSSAYYTPMWSEDTQSIAFARSLRQELAANGFDPATPVQFRWDGHWTNSRLTILTCEESPRFRESVSNSVAAHVARYGWGIPVSIAAP